MPQCVHRGGGIDGRQFERTPFSAIPASHLCCRSLFRRIGPGLIGAAQQIVHTDAVEIGQGMECIDRNIQIAQFIVRVCALVYLQKLGQVFLFQVSILSQITDSVLIHVDHPNTVWDMGISHIDF